ncbi:DUF4097 family beta strand repeat-containing protein [Lactobacillus sp. ESL0791]|uniref:DUF4097 family beta strand repeat-containing protein n=1 Tax=Lactobacillus sp. ESL0791 TaxID=2983234 RepID=UPI0023F95186|nr:DUF4097 family beta strand repeat-containing protein [Lactobacillus sp. ESL0791]MDF7637900.1 DUF4097 family beta strand repeat-containing protein [Lactobacillus sp. ESL0791]
MDEMIANYIKELDAALTELPEQERQQALDYYRTFLEYEKPNDAAEIKLVLGSPEDLAQEILNKTKANARVGKYGFDTYIHNFHVERNTLRTHTFQPEPFSKIKLELQTADITIHHGTECKVEVAEFDNHPIATKVVDDTLIITEQKVAATIGFGVFIGIHTPTLMVEITIPDNLPLALLSGYDYEGDIRINNIKVQDIQLEQRDGDLDLYDVQIDQDLTVKANDGDIAITQAQIDNGAIVMRDGDITLRHNLIKQFNLEIFDGDIAFHQNQLNLNLRSNDGDLYAEHNNFKGNNMIKLNDGDAKLIGIGNKLNYQAKSIDGDITYQGKDVGNDFSIKANSTDYLQIKTTDGDISIN